MNQMCQKNIIKYTCKVCAYTALALVCVVQISASTNNEFTFALQRAALPVPLSIPLADALTGGSDTDGMSSVGSAGGITGYLSDISSRDSFLDENLTALAKRSCHHAPHDPPQLPPTTEAAAALSRARSVGVPPSSDKASHEHQGCDHTRPSDASASASTREPGPVLEPVPHHVIHDLGYGYSHALPHALSAGTEDVALRSVVFPSGVFIGPLAVVSVSPAISVYFPVDFPVYFPVYLPVYFPVYQIVRACPRPVGVLSGSASDPSYFHNPEKSPREEWSQLWPVAPSSSGHIGCPLSPSEPIAGAHTPQIRDVNAPKKRERPELESLNVPATDLAQQTSEPDRPLSALALLAGPGFLEDEARYRARPESPFFPVPE